jgi:hypothetical protein
VRSEKAWAIPRSRSAVACWYRSAARGEAFPIRFMSSRVEGRRARVDTGGGLMSGKLQLERRRDPSVVGEEAPLWHEHTTPHITRNILLFSVYQNIVSRAGGHSFDPQLGSFVERGHPDSRTEDI